jgi:hypothetical protein
MNSNIKICFFTRITTYFLIFNYLGTKLNYNFSLIFSNISLFTINKFEFYRIITSFFISNNIYELIFLILINIILFNYLEKKLGSIKFILNIFLNCFLIQIFLLIIYNIFSIFYKNILLYKIKVFQFIAISYIIKLIFILYPNRYIIINNIIFIEKINVRLLLLFFSIGFLYFNSYNIFEYVFSIYYGYLMSQTKFFNFEFLIKENTYYELENMDFMNIVKNFNCFIKNVNFNDIKFNDINDNNNNNNKKFKKIKLEGKDENSFIYNNNNIENKEIKNLGTNINIEGNTWIDDEQLEINTNV